MSIPPAQVADTQSALSAEAVVSLLAKRGYTHLVWLPDSESAALFTYLQRSRALTLVQVCREGEAFGVAAGLIAAGARPVVVIQSTGFFESGDSLRGLALWLRLPLPVLIGYRGWNAEGRSRDSAAWYLEPILQAWKIPYRFVHSSADISVLHEVIDQAEQAFTPSAALITAEWR